MQRDWWKQKSTATMRSDGSYLDCSNTTDSTGYYTYRKDGKKDGECWGMDFEQARRDYNESLGSCKSDTKLCMDSLLSSCVCLFHVHDMSCFCKLSLPFPSDPCHLCGTPFSRWRLACMNTWKSRSKRQTKSTVCVCTKSSSARVSRMGSPGI